MLYFASGSDFRNRETPWKHYVFEGFLLSLLLICYYFVFLAVAVG
jgi:hypothetical protein